MRIISGSYKGKRLTAPKNLPVRPTTDFAKESLFNILGNRVNFHEITVLDLFSGTGNISYEFASRGALQVTAIDAHFGCVKYIQKITQELDFPITTIKFDVFKYLSKTHPAVDIIFGDPPYDFEHDKFEEMVSNIFENKLLNENGMLILEHSKHLDVSSIPNFSEARRYGGSVFSFFL